MSEESSTPQSLDLIQRDTDQSLSLAETMVIGSKLEYLRLSPEFGVPTQDVLDYLIDLEQLLSQSDIDTSVNELIASYRKGFHEDFIRDESEGKHNPTELKQHATTWASLLYQDLSQEERIPATSVGIFDVEGLIDSPEELFRSDVWQWMDQRPRNDISESCRCVATGCPTASVILSLRAVEHCLRKWHVSMGDEIESAWGRALDELMEEFADDSKKNDTLLAQMSDLPPVLTNLYYLKEKRNEVNHPDRSPDVEEAQQTLAIASSTIKEIFLEMNAGVSTDDIDADVGFQQQLLNEINLVMKKESIDGAVILALDALEDSHEDGVPRDELVELCTAAGMSRAEVENAIDSLLMSGKAYEPYEEQYKAI